MGIPEELYKVVTDNFVKELCAIGRIDFVVDNLGKLKIVEFNSETPAGLVESMAIPNILKDKLNLKLVNPNENFRSDIKVTFEKILNQLQEQGEIKNIAVVTTYISDYIFQ